MARIVVPAPPVTTPYVTLSYAQSPASIGSKWVALAAICPSSVAVALEKSRAEPTEDLSMQTRHVNHRLRMVFLFLGGLQSGGHLVLDHLLHGLVDGGDDLVTHGGQIEDDLSRHLESVKESAMSRSVVVTFERRTEVFDFPECSARPEVRVDEQVDLEKCFVFCGQREALTCSGINFRANN